MLAIRLATANWLLPGYVDGAQLWAVTGDPRLQHDHRYVRL